MIGTDQKRIDTTPLYIYALEMRVKGLREARRNALSACPEWMQNLTSQDEKAFGAPTDYLKGIKP